MSKDIVVALPSGTGAAIGYLPVMEKHTVLGGYVVPSAITGAEAIIALKVGATTIGSATIPLDNTAGVPIPIVMHATLATRKTAIDKTKPLIVEGDGGQTTATAFHVVVRLDVHALSRD